MRVRNAVVPTGLNLFCVRYPGAEAPGYFQASLRDGSFWTHIRRVRIQCPQCCALPGRRSSSTSFWTPFCEASEHCAELETDARNDVPGQSESIAKADGVIHEF